MNVHSPHPSSAPSRSTVLSWLTLLALAAGCQQAVLPPQPAVTTTPVIAPANQPVATKTTQPAPPDQPPPTQSITWEQLDIGMEPDSVYQPWMMKHDIKLLDGKPVRLKGFMHGAVFQRTGIRTFHLMREFECPFGPGGQAHHAMQVDLQGKLRTNFTTDEITVEGIFHIRPVTGENGNTWSLYYLEGTAVQ
jgi:hypothetical protein